MKDVLFVLINEAAAIICATGAVLLALYEKPGWGWFIFGALCMTTTYTFNRKDK